MIKIILVDDHKIVLDGLKALLSTTDELEIIGEAQNGLILLHQLKTLKPDLVLLDIGMPVMDGIEAAAKIKKKYPEIKVLILSTYAEKAKIKKMLTIGVDGYILKDSDKEALLNAIKTVMSSDQKYYDHRVTDVIMNSYQPKKVDTQMPRLTKRELEITTGDMKTGNIESALRRFETRINSSMLSDVIRGLVGVVSGNQNVVYFEMLSHDFKALEIQKLKAEVMKRPSKIKKYSMMLLGCFILTYLSVMFMQIIESMGDLF